MPIMQVMLIKNLATESGLVNGARGVVVGFSAPDDPSSAAYLELAKSINPGGQWPIVRFACNMRLRTVGPESWSVLSGDREIARRAQVDISVIWSGMLLFVNFCALPRDCMRNTLPDKLPGAEM